MTFTFKKAIRENVSLLLAISGGAGSGKTFSAMRLAAGIAGDKPFAVVDTEAGRAKHYADRFNFDHCDLEPPFTPARYLEAIKAADAAHYPVIVIDSASHEHAGEGGMLDMHESELGRIAGDDWRKREACKLIAWAKPKQEHKKYINGLLQIRSHVILCLRAEEKVEVGKDEKGKTVIVPKTGLIAKDGWVPICDKSLPFEATVFFLLLANDPGTPHPIKLQEQHREIFPAGKLIDEECGERLRQWASSAPEMVNAENFIKAVEALEFTEEYAIKKAASLWGGEWGQRLLTADLTKAQASKIYSMLKEERDKSNAGKES